MNRSLTSNSPILYSFVQIIGESTGEDSNHDEVDLLQEIREMTLSTILSKIFSETLYQNLRDNYLELKFETSEEYLNNEIATWVSAFESMYPSISRQIMFIKPDYNQTEFYSMEYKYEDSLITIEEIARSLDKCFEKEHNFLEGVVKVLTTLLNAKGDLKSVISEFNPQPLGKFRGYSMDLLFSCCI